MENKIRILMGDDEKTIGKALREAFNESLKGEPSDAKCLVECLSSRFKDDSKPTIKSVYSDRASRLCDIGDMIEEIESGWDSKKYAEHHIRAFTLIGEIDKHINELDRVTAELLYYTTPPKKPVDDGWKGDVR